MQNKTCKNRKVLFITELSFYNNSKSSEKFHSLFVQKTKVMLTSRFAYKKKSSYVALSWESLHFMDVQTKWIKHLFSVVIIQSNVRKYQQMLISFSCSCLFVWTKVKIQMDSVFKDTRKESCKFSPQRSLNLQFFVVFTWYNSLNNHPEIKLAIFKSSKDQLLD